MTQDLPNDGAVGDSRDEPQQPLTAKWTRQDASWLVIRFDSGEAWIDVPETAVPVVRTPQAVATTSPAGLVAHVGPPKNHRHRRPRHRGRLGLDLRAGNFQRGGNRCLDRRSPGQALRFDLLPRSPGPPNCAELTGWAALAAGGPTRKKLTLPQKALDREVRLRISQEMGHEREQITAVYLGR